MSKRRTHRHELPKQDNINITPLIDVVFQLLIFFMLASSLLRPNQVEINLPESTTGTKSQDDPAIVVYYRHDRIGAPQIMVNNDPVEGLKELTEMMDQIGGELAEKPRVDIRIEKTIPYQEVVEIMDSVRDAGYPKFSLLTIAQYDGT